MAATGRIVATALTDLVPRLLQSEGLAEVAAALARGESAAVDGAWGSSCALTAAAVASCCEGTLLVVLPLALYFQDLHLNNTYAGLVWVYQLISLPLILWIVRGYFEDMSPDIEHAFRIDGHSWLRTFLKVSIPLARPGIAAAGLLAFIFCWNNFVFALILASADKQPVTVGALAFVTASGIQYGQIAASIVLSIIPTLALALYAQRYLVEGLSLGAVKG